MREKAEMLTRCAHDKYERTAGISRRLPSFLV